MRCKQLVSFLFIVLLVPGIAFCQAQEDEDVFATEGSAIVVTSTADEDGIVGTRVMAMGPDEMGDMPMMFAGSLAGDMDFSLDIGGSAFSLLNNTSVQKDLQLVDEQLKQIDDINKEFRDKMKEKMAEFKTEDGRLQIEHGAGFGDFINELKQQQEAQIESVLLPNQQDRLQQVSRQMKMKRMGSERILTRHLAEELGISPEQKKRIRDKSKELQKNLEDKIAELKAKAKEELLSELSKDQRAKLENLLGDEFVVKEEDRKPRFQRMLDRRKKNAGDF